MLVAPPEKLVLENLCRNCGMELPLSEWASKPIIRCPKCGLFVNRLPIIEFQPEDYAPIPDVKLKWVRLQEHIPFTKTTISLALGIRGAGKSSLLEVLAIRHRKIIDLYGSSDMEGLSWCKPEFERVWKAIHGREPKILLVTGKGRELACKFGTCKINELTLQKFEEYDVITTVEHFFESEGLYFEAVSKIVDILWKKRLFWTVPWFVLVREASNWLYARTKTVQNDKFAKAEFIKAMRESRHHGLSMGVDTLRWTAIDKEIRDLADYVWVKRLGAVGLPDDLRWLYRYFSPISIMRMLPSRFALTTAKGSVGMGVFDYPPWHKQEHENILKIVGIEVKRVECAVPDTRNYNSGNFEHAEIIRSYNETRSMNQTATENARSYKTVYNHIAKHNKSVQYHGKCMKCHNAKSEFADQEIIVPNAGRPTKKARAKRARKKAEQTGEAPKQKPSFRRVNID